MRLFRLAPPKVESGGMKIRDRILENYYTLASHAAERMAQRGITLRDVIDCIPFGRIGCANPREVKEDFLCMTFWHGKTGEELIVPVRSAFGDYDAKPIILTAYRNSLEDYVPEGDIDDVVEHVVVEKVVTKAPVEMTDEELEAELVRRRDERCKKAKHAAEARANGLRSKKARLIADRNALDKELRVVDEELGTVE